jgi:Fe-S-cluster containining protein
MAWAPLLDELKAAHRQFDQETEDYSKVDAVPQIFCAKGCSNCCKLAVNCSFPEALLIVRHLTAGQHPGLNDKLPGLRDISTQAGCLKEFLRLFRKQLGGCPFLHPENGSCTIYSYRPYSCRALLSIRNSSWCGFDFADLHPLEKQAFLSSLDPEIVAYPTHYLAATQELGLEREAQTLADMRDTFGASLSGNLIYQVWLELEYQLSEVFRQGFSATRNFLEDRELDWPFLLQLREQ